MCAEFIIAPGVHTSFAPQQARIVSCPLVSQRKMTFSGKRKNQLYKSIKTIMLFMCVCAHARHPWDPPICVKSDHHSCNRYTFPKSKIPATTPRVVKAPSPEGSPSCARYTPHVNFGTRAEVHFSSHFGDADVRENAFGPPPTPRWVYTWYKLKIVFFWGVPHFGALFGHFGHFA